jgi:transcription-repair coupling factor (superfamily II helicase)
MLKINIPIPAKAFYAASKIQLNSLSCRQDEFKDEAAERMLIREHSRDPQNSLVNDLMNDAVASSSDMLLIASSEAHAQDIVKQSQFYSEREVLYLPSFDSLPYDASSPRPNILSSRAKVLTRLAGEHTHIVLVTSAINLITKLPPPAIFINNTLVINKSLKITIDQITRFLSENGFIRSASAIDSGEFAVKGEIVDIVVSQTESYRVLFNWNNIESIKTYDPATQLSSGSVEEIIISPASEIILNKETTACFKNNYLKNFGAQQTNTPLFEAIMECRKYPAHEYLLPLFYDKLYALCDYLNNPIIVYDNFALQSILEHQTNISDFYFARVNANKLHTNNFYPVLPPKSLILDTQEINKTLNKPGNIFITSEVENESDINVITQIDLEKLKRHMMSKIIIVCSTSKYGLECVKNVLSAHSKDRHPEHNRHHELASGSNAQGILNQVQDDGYYNIISHLKDAKSSVINIATNVRLDASFIADRYLMVAQHDLIPDKHIPKKARSAQARLKNILAELESLQESELVVHKEHGIGRFLGIETITAAGQPHDCLKILYADNAKLYVPVENIDNVKKYGNFEVELDRLGSASWQKRKGKLKNRITEIAYKLIEVTAKRKTATVEPIAYNHEEYDQFCQKFPYIETEDQLKAIEDVKQDLSSGIVMDRLICGDVGYGKTEVALRAAFMVASDDGSSLRASEAKRGNPACSEGKMDCRVGSSEPPRNDHTTQVAIIVPTTILCKQHYKRFTDRFAGTGLKVASLSRLSSSAEIKKIKEEIKVGDVNIIIGTHALFSKDLQFKDLGLIIIDEEQHFGVAQKETLKQIKPGVHVLSLSATPIPRTLQMSMVGLKDLSLIAEAPVDRLAIRTNIMPFDGVIVQDALLKEHARGGKSFYVVPRISDIAEVEKRILSLVPELTYKIAHGGLAPLVVDKTMQEFDDGKFDILISTSIIESGIDIPSANTMIIHKSDQFGLAQSYQLRGRIGRGKIRGYVYFTLENKKTTANAMRRLEILQTLDSLGVGFTIASHDMDFRGFGNLVGEEQSGHIKEVGVELYQDMLDEQIALISNQKQNVDEEERTATAINLGLAVFIPGDYIADSSLRLGIYRRIGNLKKEEIESFKDEMLDRFGRIPQELNNLLEIVKIKHICRELNIRSLDAAEKGFVVKFYKDADIHDTVMKFVNKFPLSVKIKPDNKLVFIKNLDKARIIEETLWFLEQLKVV